MTSCDKLVDAGRRHFLRGGALATAGAGLMPAQDVQREGKPSQSGVPAVAVANGIEGVLNSITAMLNGTIARSIAVLAVMAIGFAGCSGNSTCARRACACSASGSCSGRPPSSARWRVCDG
jgi:hypothetical protein